jgi:hypothetical protein
MFGWADERVFDGAGEQILCGGGRNQTDCSPVPLSSPPRKRGPQLQPPDSPLRMPACDGITVRRRSCETLENLRTSEYQNTSRECRPLSTTSAARFDRPQPRVMPHSSRSATKRRMTGDSEQGFALIPCIARRPLISR